MKLKRSITALFWLSELAFHRFKARFPIEPKSVVSFSIKKLSRKLHALWESGGGCRAVKFCVLRRSRLSQPSVDIGRCLSSRSATFVIRPQSVVNAALQRGGIFRNIERIGFDYGSVCLPESLFEVRLEGWGKLKRT